MSTTGSDGLVAVGIQSSGLETRSTFEQRDPARHQDLAGRVRLVAFVELGDGQLAAGQAAGRAAAGQRVGERPKALCRQNQSTISSVDRDRGEFLGEGGDDVVASRW
jgi:hypothetical protein